MSPTGKNVLWRFVAWGLAKVGIESVLVGGACVAIYSEGAYRSGDLDIVSDGVDRQSLVAAMKGLGFVEEGRHFRHPECAHLYVEFVQGPVFVGSDYGVEPDTVEIEGISIQLLSPTDCIKDRLAAWIHWQAREGLDQAVLVARRQHKRVDWDSLRSWAEKEGGEGALADLERLLGADG